MRPLIAKTIVAGCLIVLSAGCGATEADDQAVCGNPKNPVADILQACTRIIANPVEPPLRIRVIALDRRAQAFAKQGDTEPAMSDLDTALSLAPNYPFARLHRADLLRKAGRLTDALDDLDVAVEMLPKAFVYLERGHVRWANGDLDGAVADFGDAAKLDPKQPFGLFNRGSLYLQRGRLDDAIVDFDAAATIAPTFRDIYLRRAAAYRAKGAVPEAIADLSKAIALDPRDAATFETRGVTYAQTGDVTHAIADYKTVIDLGGASPSSYVEFGIIYMQAGDPRAAVTQFDKALSLDPTFVQALRSRARAHQALKETAQAQADVSAADHLAAESNAAALARTKKVESAIFGPNGDLHRLDGK